MAFINKKLVNSLVNTIKESPKDTFRHGNYVHHNVPNVAVVSSFETGETLGLTVTLLNETFTVYPSGELARPSVLDVPEEYIPVKNLALYETMESFLRWRLEALQLHGK